MGVKNERRDVVSVTLGHSFPVRRNYIAKKTNQMDWFRREEKKEEGEETERLRKFYFFVFKFEFLSL